MYYLQTTAGTRPNERNLATSCRSKSETERGTTNSFGYDGHNLKIAYQ